ncbi:Oxysterol-binding protein-related protein 9 [Portunus trituberculatus]|uniref:Oxysterol-binding protein-related protein 9 n=1 Tax=Portunus trituberculatus TaxID=210409 RepID=A0A5B7DB12_PORTR|nr:Oxysterol-binding protein-related protein 9 [Portunus trituberculatus]
MARRSSPSLSSRWRCSVVCQGGPWGISATLLDSMRSFLHRVLRDSAPSLPLKGTEAKGIERMSFACFPLNRRCQVRSAKLECREKNGSPAHVQLASHAGPPPLTSASLLSAAPPVWPLLARPLLVFPLMIQTVMWSYFGSKQRRPSASSVMDYIRRLKPFYGGKKHRISAEVFSPGERKPFLTVDGEWNGAMVAKARDSSESMAFVDTKSMATVKKNVKPIAEQAENESRFMWKEVTAGLKFNQIDEATSAKFALEQRQREEAKHRKENGLTWETKLFDLVADNWVYKYALLNRFRNN